MSADKTLAAEAGIPEVESGSHIPSGIVGSSVAVAAGFACIDWTGRNGIAGLAEPSGVVPVLVRCMSDVPCIGSGLRSGTISRRRFDRPR